MCGLFAVSVSSNSLTKGTLSEKGPRGPRRAQLLPTPEDAETVVELPEVRYCSSLQTVLHFLYLSPLASLFPLSLFPFS